MYKKDYILRMVEEMIRFIAKVMSLLKEGKPEEAEKWLEKGYQLLKADHQKMLQMKPGELVQELERQGYDYTKMELKADLINAESEILAYKQDQKAADLLITALAVYEYIENNHHVYSFERADKIFFLKSRIGDSPTQD